MIVDAGKKGLGELVIANSAFTYVGVGDGGDDTSTSQTELDNEVKRKLATVNMAGNTLVYNVTFTGADLSTNLIRELGIFNHETIGSGTLLTRVSFDAIGPLSSSDEVKFIFRLEVE